MTVDARHAAAALVSFLCVQFDDPTKARSYNFDLEDPLYGIHATRDGRFVQLHPSFHDAPALLDLPQSATTTPLRTSWPR